MLAYVNEVQHREREIGCDVLTHQKWLAILGFISFVPEI